MKRPTVHISTDGCVGGWCAILVYHRTTRVLWGPADIGKATSQRGELTAVLKGLEALTRPCRVTIHSDSQYAVQGVNNWVWTWQDFGWRRADGGKVANVDLWKLIVKACKPHIVKMEWQKGHDNEELNETADLYAALGKETGVHRSDCLL